MLLNSQIFYFKWQYLFIINTILYCGIGWLTNSLILTDAYYYSSLGNQISSERINEIIELNNKFQWLGYTMLPILLLLKWGVLSAIIYIGIFFFNEEMSFYNCLKVIIISEFAMIISAFVKLIVFVFSKPETITAIKYFYPLSITQIINPENIPNYLIYPLQQFNLFEVAYWILISAGIQSFTKLCFWKSFRITASSYGVALLVWILFIVFIQLQFS